MNSINNGGPAFPRPASMTNTGSAGMTLRDYFIAHAPAEPQPWFHPEISGSRPRSRWIGEDGKEYANASEAERECGDCFSNANLEAQHAWDDELIKQRYIQWPAAWADAILKERK